MTNASSTTVAARARVGASIAVALAAVYVALMPLAYLAGARPAGRRFAPYVALEIALFALQIATWGVLRASPSRGRVVALIVAAGCVARLALVATPAYTTTDAARYLWDGAVALDHHDPWAIAPGDPSLDALARTFPRSADHHDVVTCYPPLAVALFALCASTGARTALLAWKLVVALAGCAACVQAWRALRGTAREPDVVLLALSPCLVLEGGVGAHLDALAAACVVVAVLAAERAHWRRAALWIGVAGALKLVPLALALPLFAFAPRRITLAALCALPLAVTVAIAVALGAVPVGSLGAFATLWYFSAPAWSLLFHFLPDEKLAIRTALAVAGLAALCEIALANLRSARAVRDGYGAMLVATPVLHPWYASMLAAVAPLAPSAWALAVPAALPLSYEVIDGYQRGVGWHPRAWPTVAITVVALGALGIDAALRRRRAR